MQVEPGGPHDGAGERPQHPVRHHCFSCDSVAEDGPSNVCPLKRCKRPLDDHQWFSDHNRAMCPE